MEKQELLLRETMESNSPVCCPTGSWPQLLRTREEINGEETPTFAGEVIMLDQATETRAYVVQPNKESTPFKGSLMVIPDIYSVRALNLQSRSGDRMGVICDALAAQGYRVALLDIFHDEPFDMSIGAPSDGKFEKFQAFAQNGAHAWFTKHNYQHLAASVRACKDYLMQNCPEPNKSLGAIGFCFGTWVTSKANAMGDVDFTCSVGYHPSTRLEGFHGGDEIQLLNSLKMPTLFMWAGNDSEVFLENKPGRDALEKTGGGVLEFSDMLHGWVSRGDVANDLVKRDVEKALNSTFEFLEKHMGETTPTKD